MAFEIKKDLHLNTGIYLKLLDDPTNDVITQDNFQNDRYTIPIEMVGHDITDGSGVKWFQNSEGNWVELKIGKSTDFEFSGALYNKLAGHKSGSTVQIMLKEMEGKNGKYAGWTVTPMNGASEPSNNAEKPPKSSVFPKTNTNYGITWGMCINNATQIVMKQGIDGNSDIGEQVEQVARELMEVAVDGLARWEQTHNQKDQNDKPNDGLPF